MIKCKTKFILVFFILFWFSDYSNCYSQKNINSIITLDTIIELPNIKNPKLNRLIYYNLDEYLFYIYYDSPFDKQKFTLNRLNIDNGSIDRYEGEFNYQELKGGIFKHYSIHFSSMIVYDSTLFLIIYDKLYSYKIKGNKLILLRQDNIESDMINIVNNSIFLYQNYNYDKKSKKTPTIIQLYNYDANVVDKYITPKFQNLCYTHFEPNNWLDFSNNSISFCQTIDYNVNFYDTLLRKTTSLTREMSIWKKAPVIQDKIGHDCLDYYNPWESRVSRILSGFFANDTTFIIQYKLPKNSDHRYQPYYFDIWKYSDSTWELDIADLCNCFEYFPKGDEFFTKENFPFNSLTYSDFFIKNNKIFSFHLEQYVNPIEIKVKDFKEQQQKFILDQNSEMQICIYIYNLL